MGQRLIITENERRRILGLYEQTTSDEVDLITFLTDNKFEEDTSRIGSYQIKSDDGTFAIVFVLNPENTEIKTATIVGPDEILNGIEDIFSGKSVPVVKTQNKITTRQPFSDKEIISALVEKIKKQNEGF